MCLTTRSHDDTPNTPSDPAADPAAAAPADASDAALQGEGNYTAARRHRASVKDFIDAGGVDEAAHQAAPQTAAEERDMKDAETEGRAHAKR